MSKPLFLAALFLSLSSLTLAQQCVDCPVGSCDGSPFHAPSFPWCVVFQDLYTNYLAGVDRITNGQCDSLAKTELCAYTKASSDYSFSRGCDTTKMSELDLLPCQQDCISLAKQAVTCSGFPEPTIQQFLNCGNFSTSGCMSATGYVPPVGPGICVACSIAECPQNPMRSPQGPWCSLYQAKYTSFVQSVDNVTSGRCHDLAVQAICNLSNAASQYAQSAGCDVTHLNASALQPCQTDCYNVAASAVQCSGHSEPEIAAFLGCPQMPTSNCLSAHGYVPPSRAKAAQHEVDSSLLPSNTKPIEAIANPL